MNSPLQQHTSPNPKPWTSADLAIGSYATPQSDDTKHIRYTYEQLRRFGGSTREPPCSKVRDRMRDMRQLCSRSGIPCEQ